VPLYQIQDADRPGFVFAANFSEAIARWSHAVAVENECDVTAVEPPSGVNHLADDEDIIIADQWVK